MADKAGWEETKAIWQKPENRMFYRLFGAALLVGIGVLVGGAIFADRAVDYQINLFTDVISIAVTVLILDLLAERRADRKAEEALKRQLVMDAGSLSNEVAKNAIYQIRKKGWLEGEHGLLRGADLSNANLQGADLSRANLQRAHLTFANLQEALLTDANLSGTDLLFADMPRAILGGANLYGAHLLDTDLEKASLYDANLCAASLFETNLSGVELLGAKFDQLTGLPDRSFWTSETDMRRFTDSEYKNFWRSGDPFSPAYRGKSEE